MITESEIRFISSSYRDPIGRCFTAQKRFFRAINNEFEDEMLEFLNSELYRELRLRNWVVETWRADDVKVEGYSLILEHKKVQAYSWQYLSFEQLKDAACLHVDIENLCNFYGYHIKDAGFNNIGLDEGCPVFIDFGSFAIGSYKGEGFMREFGIMYKRLLDMSLLDYQTARSLEPRQYVHDVINGGKTIINSIEYLKKIHPLVKYYTVRRKYSSSSFLFVKTIFSLNCIEKINRLVQVLLRKRTSWQCFKIVPKYHSLKKKNIIALKANYEYKPTLNKLGKKALVKSLEFLSSKKQISSIIFVGNYTIEDYKELRTFFNGDVFLCTKEPFLADSIYSKAKKQKLAFNVLCGDAKMLQSFVEEKHMEESVLFIVAQGNIADFEKEIMNKENVIYEEI